MAVAREAVVRDGSQSRSSIAFNPIESTHYSVRTGSVRWNRKLMVADGEDGQE